MSAPTMTPHSRLQRLATLDRLATAATWVFWFFAVLTSLQVILAVTRAGVLFGPTLSSQPGLVPRAWVTIAPPLLQHAGSVIVHSGLDRGVQASWNSAILGTAQAARLVLSLGWWLLAGGLVASLAEGLARLNLLGLLVTWHVDWAHWPASWGWSWPVEWLGLGLIIFARIMRVSAGMRADLEGTV
jgi:hypothetical protein